MRRIVDRLIDWVQMVEFIGSIVRQRPIDRALANGLHYLRTLHALCSTFILQLTPGRNEVRPGVRKGIKDLDVLASEITNRCGTLHNPYVKGIPLQRRVEAIRMSGTVPKGDGVSEVEEKLRRSRTCADRVNAGAVGRNERSPAFVTVTSK